MSIDSLEGKSPPILLPAHKLDTNALAKYAFRRSARMFFLMFFCLGFGLGFVFREAFGWPPFTELGTGVLLGLLMLPVMSWRIRGRYNSPAFAQFRVPRTMSLDDRAFRLDYQNGVSTTIPWTVVTGIKQNGDFLLFQSIMGSPIPIPRSLITPNVSAFIEQRVAEAKAASLVTNAW